MDKVLLLLIPPCNMGATSILMVMYACTRGENIVLCSGIGGRDGCVLGQQNQHNPKGLGSKVCKWMGSVG